MKKTFSILLALCCLSSVWAVDETYYSSLDGKSQTELFSAVKTVATKGYTSVSYKGLWTAFKQTDLDANGNIWDMYGGCTFTYSSDQCGNYDEECDCYNREHSIPKSWFGGTEANNTPGCDLFHLFPTDGYVNNKRSNNAFGEVSSATYTYNGNKLGSPKSISVSGTILSSGSSTQSCSASVVFEPQDQYKGDFARAYMATMVRWSGDFRAFVTEDGATIFSSTYTASGKYGLTPYGVALLMKWHRQDPVSQKEIDRNNGIQATQGNRNPFVDYPYLAEYIWGEHSGEALSMAHMMASFSAEFVPGKSNGWKESTALPQQETEVLLTLEEGMVKNPQGVECQVYDMQGRFVLSTTGDIVLSDLPQGISLIHTTGQTLKVCRP